MTKSTKITEEVTEEVTETEEKTPLVLNIEKTVSSIKTAENSFKTAKAAISKKAMVLTVYCGEYFVIHGNDKETVEKFNKEFLVGLSRQVRDKVSGTASNDRFQKKLKAVQKSKADNEETFTADDFINEIANDFPKKGNSVNSLNSMRDAFQDKENLTIKRFDGLDSTFQTYATVSKLLGQISYDNLQAVLMSVTEMGPDKQGSGVIPSDKADALNLAILGLLTPIAKSLDTKQTDNG